MSPLEARDQFIKITVLGALALGAVLFAFILSASPLFSVMIVLGGLWMISVPRHAELCLIVATATYSAGLVVPFLPGRPMVWEAMAVLGWSGVAFRLALRRISPEFGRMLRRNALVYVCLAGYLAVLFFLIRRYGVGFGSMGSQATGGRRYATQIVGAIFPLVYIVLMPDEKTLSRLFLWQCALTITYLLGELLLNYGTGGIRYLLLLFDTTTDAVGFAVEALNMGIRRIQALFYVSLGMTSLFLALVPMRDLFRIRKLWLWVFPLAFLISGGLSGHRYTLYGLATLYFFTAYGQRMLRGRFLVMGAVIIAVLLMVAYTMAPSLPDSMQRMMTLLPGVRVSSNVAVDATISLEGRKEIWQVGWQVAPQYFKVGRGFGIMPEAEWIGKFDLFAQQMATGVFYNGTLGLVINTGIAGTVFMMGLVLIGFWLCWRVFGLLRKHGWEDRFARVCSVIAANYCSVGLSFIFLHGDSEQAMRSFSLSIGMLIVCLHHLRVRVQVLEAAAPPAAKPAYWRLVKPRPTPESLPAFPGGRPSPAA